MNAMRPYADVTMVSNFVVGARRSLKGCNEVELAYGTSDEVAREQWRARMIRYGRGRDRSGSELELFGLLP